MQTQGSFTRNLGTQTGLVVFALLGWGFVWYLSKQPPVTIEKIVTQEVVKYVDRVVTKDVVRTETRPDGTKIVTETKSNETTKIDTKTKSKESVITRPVLSKYSLGVSYRPDHILIPTIGTTTFEVGRRFYSSPLWVTASVNTKREVTLGVRWEF